MLAERESQEDERGQKAERGRHWNGGQQGELLTVRCKRGVDGPGYAGPQHQSDGEHGPNRSRLRSRIDSAEPGIQSEKSERKQRRPELEGDRRLIPRHQNRASFHDPGDSADDRG